MDKKNGKTNRVLLIAGVVALLILSLTHDSDDAEQSPMQPTDGGRQVDSAHMDGEAPESRQNGASDLRGSGATDQRARVLGVAKEPSRERRSIADVLLAQLRELSKQSLYHAPAWRAIRVAAERLAQVGDESLQAELAELELAFLDAGESDRVRGACLILMAWRGPEHWFEERVGAVPAVSPELERAGWIAFALRRSTPPALEMPLAEFPSPTKRVTYPAVVRRRATPREFERAHARLGVLLPKELYENGLISDEVYEEQFTREVIVLAVFGPGAELESEERDQLLDWITPRNPEEGLVRLAAGFALARAARSSEDLAKRMLQAMTADRFHQYRIRMLRFIANESGRPGLAVDALATLLRNQASDSGIQADQILGLDLLAELLELDDPLVRDQAQSLALEAFLDSRNGALVRSFGLSAVARLDPALVGDALVLSLAGEEDSKLLAYASVSLRQLANVDRPAAVQLFARILAHEGLTASDKSILVNQISLMGGPEAIELLQRFATSETDPELRSRALELLAKL